MATTVLLLASVVLASLACDGGAFYVPAAPFIRPGCFSSEAPPLDRAVRTQQTVVSAGFGAAPSPKPERPSKKGAAGKGKKVQPTPCSL